MHLKELCAGSNLFTSSIINVNNGCPAVKTAGHPAFPGFFTLKMPV